MLKQQEQFRRYQLQQQQNLQMGLPATMANADFPSDGLMAEAMRTTPVSSSAARKRSFSGAEEFDLSSFKSQVKRNDPIVRQEDAPLKLPKSKPRGRPSKKSKASRSSLIEEPGAREAVEALVGTQFDDDESDEEMYDDRASEEHIYSLGTVDDLLNAAQDNEKTDEAAKLMIGFKEVDWPDSESESKEEQSIEGGDTPSISLPGFQSKLPALREEPLYDEATLATAHNVAKSSKKDGKDETNKEKGDLQSPTPSTGSKASPSKPERTYGEYPYPVDTWWPSITTIRRERRMHGEVSDEEDFVENGTFTADSPFRADLPAIRKRFSKDVTPGVLEKIPHCKIHRARMKSTKSGSTPDHAFCWQVTESYCNDVMVCCSVCSTWRHASCGGHYKSFSVRDTIRSDTAFIPVCDLCHEEQKVLEDFPDGAKRMERQRVELLRRALQTSGVIRQASFAKHSGTYKWPLGSVSATHIGGHTRSVHSRHDKAEKQWSEMAQKLGRGYGYRAKERTKVRTRELERLLTSVEDAEAFTDRHNMMQFLQHDSRKKDPAGFEQARQNLFDPEDDIVPAKTEETGSEPQEKHEKPGLSLHIGRKISSMNYTSSENDNSGSETQSKCARNCCDRKPRFDSVYCSDSCGVVALELDLLRSLQYAGDIHPALLR